MRTKGKDDIQIVRRKKPEKDQPAPIRHKAPKPAPEAFSQRQSSLASRISASYIKMFATWLSLSLFIIFAMVVAFKILYLVYETKPHLERVEASTTLESYIQNVKSVREARFVLLDNEDRIIASSFPELEQVKSTGIIGFDVIKNKVYLTHAKIYEPSDGRTLKLVIYSDITIMLTEIIAAGAIELLLFIVSMLVVYVRGHYLTRKAFGVLDELSVKADNISSQNLNLRLNVSDSTDELVELAITFNRMMDRIEKAYEKQNQFVSDASHELRTPIAVIQGYARMLERWGMDDRDILKESITAINKESKSMQDLVDKLLFIARNDKDTLVLVKEHFDMSELVREIARETRLLETQHEIRCFVEPNVRLFGDRSRIKQALRIFVDNALKYTEPTGVITLRLDLDDGHAVAVIKDTGMGIPEKDLPNIFDRFYRVDEARERNKGGHGLGLSIARIIVLRHGGRIKVASKVGEGTRFSLYLPLNKNGEASE